MKHFAFAAAMALAPVAAGAATITVNHVMDPANIEESLFQENLLTPFTLEVGDTLDFTLTFTGGQSISLTGDSYVWLLSLTHDGSQALETTGTLEFLGASGDVLNGPIPISQTDQEVHIGNYYDQSLYRTGGGAISFSGLRQIITINSATEIGGGEDEIDVLDVGPREYYSIALDTDGQVGSAVVPEPATWALMIAGFGLAGGALRRRSAARA